MSWKPYNVRQWGSKSKSPFHFLHSEFFTITYKSLKATLLWATRLVIGCICFCWISPQYFNLFCIMFNSGNPYERLHYPWFCKKSPPIILFLIKGTVHPKMKILSSFTHLRESHSPWTLCPTDSPLITHSSLNVSFQTCITFFLMLNTRKYILKNFDEPKSCWPPLTSIVGKEILWKSMGTINCYQTVDGPHYWLP